MRFLMYVKSFCKKRAENIPNDLIYITNLLSQSFSIIIIFYYHNNFPLSQSFLIITIFFHYHNISLWSEFFLIITIFIKIS